MAQRTTVEVTDDVNGRPAAETISFGIDGHVYEIDLSTRNAARLRKSLAPWVTAARRTGGRRTTSAKAVPAVVDNAAVRAWATANGIDVSARGRIPATVIEQYQAALN